MTHRAGGILLHPTSLPGGFGIGDLGPEIDRFLDWMAVAGLRIWQVLPLHPPARENSPYGARSVFAGDPAMLSLDELLVLGLLDEDDLKGFPSGLEAETIHHREAATFKSSRLRIAWERFSLDRESPLHGELAAFADDAAAWLEDWVLFEVLDRKLGEESWATWEEDLKRRVPEALEDARARYRAELDFQVFLQFLFDRQWRRVRRAAEARGITILGDLPIYVDHHSAEVWAHPELFDLDEAGSPRQVAGVPPDYFAETGQLWGNPLYRWDRLKADGYRWWVDRLAGDLRWAHVLRLDHFRAFVAYWAVPAGSETAIDGTWLPGPGRPLFDAFAKAFRGLPVVAEDLGEITDDVYALRDALQLPGMAILQFGLESEDDLHAPGRHMERQLVYTGTHDNDTANGWYASLDAASVSKVDAALGREAGSEVPFHQDMIRAAWESVARWAIVPAQDVLGLGSEARMNIPGVPKGNWRWRLRPGELTSSHASWLRGLGEACDRVPSNQD